MKLKAGANCFGISSTRTNGMTVEPVKTNPQVTRMLVALLLIAGPALASSQALRENTVISRIKSKGDWERFAVYSNLDPGIYAGSVTLELTIPDAKEVEVLSTDRPLPNWKTEDLTDRFDVEYVRRDGRSILVTIKPNTILQFRLKQEAL